MSKNPLHYSKAQLKKAAVCAATVAANLVAAGVIDGKAALVVMAVIGGLGTYGVFLVKNAPAA